MARVDRSLLRAISAPSERVSWFYPLEPAQKKLFDISIRQEILDERPEVAPVGEGGPRTGHTKRQRQTDSLIPTERVSHSVVELHGMNLVASLSTSRKDSVLDSHRSRGSNARRGIRVDIASLDGNRWGKHLVRSRIVGKSHI